MAEISDDELLKRAVEGEIIEDQTQQQEAPAEEKSEAAKYIGTQLSHKPGESPYADKNGDEKMIEKNHLTKIGENIFEKKEEGQKFEYLDGWIDVDKSLLGGRAVFYPEDWQFRIRPATVEAIRNWSTLDEENVNSVDDVFNEILKSCLSIVTPTGPLPWGNVCSWDRFFFLLLIREYTFTQGETKISWEEDCIECENPVKFELTSTSLMFDLPDQEVMSWYDQQSRVWNIDPTQFGLDDERPISLHIPTLEKDANIKAWMISRLQENRNRRFDQTFLRFLPWLAPKVSKDTTIANTQIKRYEGIFKSWNTDMFSFMDNVLTNIIVTPSSKLTTTCSVCGEEMTSDIRFPGSIRDLFNVQSRFKKFGKK